MKDTTTQDYNPTAKATDLIYGFTLDELKRLSKEFQTHHNAELSFNDMLTILFQRAHIRSIASCDSEDNKELKKKLLNKKLNNFH